MAIQIAEMAKKILCNLQHRRKSAYMHYLTLLTFIW